MNNDGICKIVVSTITEQLAKGEVPWHKPWVSESPVNAVSKKSYRGANYFFLSLVAQVRGYTDNRWLTFNQAREFGGGVKKGEKGTHVIKWHFPETPKDGEVAKPGSRAVWARYFTVFNVEQCQAILTTDGGKLAPYAKVSKTQEPLQAAQAIHDLYAANGGPQVTHGSTIACYIPLTDKVCMPNIGTFDNSAEYHGVRFHEEVHSTGAKNRLDRDLAEVSPFGTPDYGAEELVAELGSAMLRAITGIQVNYENNAAYIANWSKVLTDAPRIFTQAAGKAQRAVDLITGATATAEE